MKIGRNDLCPCGSEKKYKKCCLIKETQSEYDLIRIVVSEQGFDTQLSDFLCSMLMYMKERNWIGACHATSSVMYVALSELGYNVQLCLGEVEAENFCFDHSWLILDEKIIDLAAAMTLMRGLPVSNPIILDVEIRTNRHYSLNYGIYKSGLDGQALAVREMPFVTYMENFPDVKGGLWGVLEKVFPGKLNIEEMKDKYQVVERKYVCDK